MATTPHAMKNPVRTRIARLSFFLGSCCSILFSFFITASGLHAQQLPDWLLSAAADSLDLQHVSNLGMAEMPLGVSFHISPLTPYAIPLPSLGSTNLVNSHGTALHPAATAVAPTNWKHPRTPSCLYSRHTSTPRPTPTSPPRVSDSRAPPTHPPTPPPPPPPP